MFQAAPLSQVAALRPWLVLFGSAGWILRYALCLRTAVNTLGQSLIYYASAKCGRVGGAGPQRVAKGDFRVS